MKRIIVFSLFFFSLSAFVGPEDCAFIKKVFIWGHQGDTHTHAWIHHGYYRAFKSLGFKVHWVKDQPYEDIDFSNSLFLVHGLQDKHVPVRKDCRYILHNSTSSKFRELIDEGNAIILQVYTHDCLDRDVVSMGDLTYFDFNGKVVYMPWATDLLPHEINEIKQQMRKRSFKKERVVHYVGSVGYSPDNPAFSNVENVRAFMRGCAEEGIGFEIHKHIPMEENLSFVQKSYMAPAIQSPWQCKQGYIPCRIFKNISYGQMGITNSKTVFDLFDGKLIYHDDAYQLAKAALKRMPLVTQEEVFALMDVVRDKHTYINRIDTLFTFLQCFKPL